MSATKHNSEKHSESESPIRSFSQGLGGSNLMEPVWYGLSGVILATTPLLNRLHVESTAVLAFVAFFVAGRVAYLRFHDPDTVNCRLFRVVIFRRLSWLFFPAAILTLAMLWAPNCDYIRGVMFLVLFPGISVVLAVSFAYFLVAFQTPFWLLVFAGIGISIVGPVFDIGLHPQFYTYNHVFGGVLGPIYDEALEVRPGLLVFRLMTLMFAGLFVAMGAARFSARFAASSKRDVHYQRLSRAGVVVSSIAIGVTYLFSAQLGINTPEWYLKSQFSGHRVSLHFDLYYDSEAVSDHMVDLWVLEHEYRYAVLSERLKTDVQGRIQSYIYRDADQRASLTGARVTSVAPVWLKTPQVHILADQVESVFSHELVHVFSREFGLPVVRASLAIGLVEGIAVALEPPDGLPDSADKVAASRLFDVQDVHRLSERLASSLGPGGFWGGRGGVSYETSGAFVSWLIDRYGVDRFKRVYAFGNFSTVYGLSVTELALKWSEFLAVATSVHRSALYSAALRFGTPSLFEQQCPHWIAPDVKKYRSAALALADGDLGNAEVIFRTLSGSETVGSLAKTALRKIRLAGGDLQFLLNEFDSESSDELSLQDEIIYADLMALSGRPDEASERYLSIRLRLPVYARMTRTALEMRALGAQFPDILSTIILIEPDSLKIRALNLLDPSREASVIERRPSDKTLANSVKESSVKESDDVDDGSRFRGSDVPVVAEPGIVSFASGDKPGNERHSVYNLIRLYWRSQYNYQSELFEAASDDAATIVELFSRFSHRILSDEARRTLLYQAATYTFAGDDLEQAGTFADRSASLADRAGDSAMALQLRDLESKIHWTDIWNGN